MRLLVSKSRAAHHGALHPGGACSRTALAGQPGHRVPRSRAAFPPNDGGAAAPLRIRKPRGHPAQPSTRGARVRCLPMPTSINVFRNDGIWRYATYVDGELCRLGDLPVEDGATDHCAIEAARRMYLPYLGGVTIERVPDIPHQRKAPMRRE